MAAPLSTPHPMKGQAMAKFTVTITRTIVTASTLEIEAASEQEAGLKARRRLVNGRGGLRPSRYDLDVQVTPLE